MRITLPIKFFLAFLLSSLTIVILMIVIMQYFAYLNFTEYVRTTEIRRLNELSDMLSEEYQIENGWDSLSNNKNRWRYLLRPLRRGPRDAPPPPPRTLSSSQTAVPEPDLERRQNRLQRPLRKNRKRGRRPLRFGIEHRLTLFDVNKQPVAGPASSPLNHTLKEVVSDNQTVGWLGLKKEKNLTQPLDIAFLKQQAKAFYMTGALMVLLAAIAAFLFARHLLAPVKQLTAGTRALTSRKFKTRIYVASKDELGQLAADFNNMAQTLENYETMQRQWLSDIAHELRTPLTVLRGEIEALQDGVRQASPDALISLHAEVSALTMLVHDLQELSLAESDALHYKLEPVAPLAVLRDILKKFQPRFTAQKIEIINELGTDLSQTVSADTSRLFQVFTNLLENSLRYTESPGTLKVRSSLMESEVCLYFEDIAPGVPTESLDRLFDRLYRVDKSRSRAQGGSGLGLAICKSIIESHNGTIKALHSPLGGVLFEITLPRSME